MTNQRRCALQACHRPGSKGAVHNFGRPNPLQHAAVYHQSAVFLNNPFASQQRRSLLTNCMPCSSGGLIPPRQKSIYLPLSQQQSKIQPPRRKQRLKTSFISFYLQLCSINADVSINSLAFELICLMALCGVSIYRWASRKKRRLSVNFAGTVSTDTYQQTGYLEKTSKVLCPKLNRPFNLEFCASPLIVTGNLTPNKKN